MNYNELVQEVYTLTGRPDLTGETASAIKAATLKAHTSDFYSKDIYETGIQFESTDYRQSLDLYNLISNFRAIKYLRRVTDANDDEGTFIEIITPEELLDGYGSNRSDVAYVAGRVLEIRSSVEFQYALLGCYVMPIVRVEAYSSWIADLYPYAIVHEAVRIVLATIGYVEEAARYSQLVAEQYALLKMNNLSDVGY